MRVTDALHKLTRRETGRFSSFKLSRPRLNAGDSATHPSISSCAISIVASFASVLIKLYIHTAISKIDNL